MKPREYDAARQSLGWTQAQLAEVLGIGRRTPYRYANGQIPEPVARLLRLLVLLHLTTSARKFNELVDELRG